MKSVNGITSVVNTINPTITVGKFDLLSGVAKTTVEQYFKNGITVKTIGNKLKDILYAEGYRACNFNTSDKTAITEATSLLLILPSCLTPTNI